MQEVLMNKVRRYTSPEEHAFFPQYLPEQPMKNLPQLEYPTLLSPDGGASDLNFNKCLTKRYLKEVIPAISREGDDEQHGSSVVCDVNLLQALSRRVHYGKFVAESKYRSDPEEYQRLVDNDDHEGVMELLTNMAVEHKLLRRVRLKAANYGREPMDIVMPLEENSTSDQKGEERRMVAVAAATAVMAALESWDHHEGDINKTSKVDPYTIEAIYRDLIIPLTKEIEVAYLFKRCGKEPPPQYRGED
jgi:chorismate mutase